MGRPKKWEPGQFQKFKLKLPGETADRYKQIIEAKCKTIQQDFQDHVEQTIK